MEEIQYVALFSVSVMVVGIRGCTLLSLWRWYFWVSVDNLLFMLDMEMMTGQRKNNINEAWTFMALFREMGNSHCLQEQKSPNESELTISNLRIGDRRKAAL